MGSPDKQKKVRRQMEVDNEPVKPRHTKLELHNLLSNFRNWYEIRVFNSFLFACPYCGALVLSRDKHLIWHEQMTEDDDSVR